MAKIKFFDTVKLETESKEPEKIIEIVNESSDSLKVPIVEKKLTFGFRH